jgi:hypothetical protein
MQSIMAQINDGRGERLGESLAQLHITIAL